MNNNRLFCLLLILSPFFSVAVHAYGTPFPTFIDYDAHLKSYGQKANDVTYRLSGGYSFARNQHFTIEKAARISSVYVWMIGINYTF